MNRQSINPLTALLIPLPLISPALALIVAVAALVRRNRMERCD